jgi:hypothetical protein
MGYETLIFYDWFVFIPFQRPIKNKLFWYMCFWKNLESTWNNVNTTSIKYMPIIWKSNNHVLIPKKKPSNLNYGQKFAAHKILISINGMGCITFTFQIKSFSLSSKDQKFNIYIYIYLLLKEPKISLKCSMT